MEYIFIALLIAATCVAIVDLRRGRQSALRSFWAWIRNVIDLLFGLG